MTDRLILAQHHLYTYYACPRRFYLRFLALVPWPEAPLGSELEAAYERGKRFHRWIERFHLGMPVEQDAAADPLIRTWWGTFTQKRPKLPEGQRFVETGLTVPIGRHFLSGRFDLLVVNWQEDQLAAATIFDWKTEEPRPLERLRQAWQTRVYLAVLAEGGTALSDSGRPSPDPNQISFIYWYVDDPERPRVVAYDAAQHEHNWAELESLVIEIDDRLTSGEWPLTDDWEQCRQCPYQAYCGRQAAGQDDIPFEDDEDTELFGESLEPDWL